MKPFYTVPDLPNYEINSDLIVRSKKTGRILKPRFMPDSPEIYYYLKINGNNRTIRAKTLWQKVFATLDTRTFYPIPSTNGRYEISKGGIVRNCLTKHILEQKGCFHFRFNGINLIRSRRDIFAECFGISSKYLRVPVIVSKGNQRHYFNNKSLAARFLAPKVSYSFGYVMRWLRERKKNIDGWHINYQL